MTDSFWQCEDFHFIRSVELNATFQQHQDPYNLFRYVVRFCSTYQHKKKKTKRKRMRKEKAKSEKKKERGKKKKKIKKKKLLSKTAQNSPIWAISSPPSKYCPSIRQRSTFAKTETPTSTMTINICSSTPEVYGRSSFASYVKPGVPEIRRLQ
ncbi:hypothetical protein VTN96DRAFT_9356 [Rasamsonia emersonii]